MGAERRRAAGGAGGAVLGRGRSLRALEGAVCDSGKVSGALHTLTHFAGLALGVSAGPGCVGGPWVCPRTTRRGAGHPPQRLGGSTTASRPPAARPGSSSGLGSRSPFAGGGEPAQGLWRRLLRPRTGLRGRCIWLWDAGALLAGLAAAGAAAALGVLIPQKMVMPRGLSGHVPGLAKTAHPKLLQIGDSSLPRLANLCINIPDLC